MSKQVEKMLAKYIEDARTANVKPLEVQHAAETAGTPEWCFTLRQLQVEQAKIAGMEIALSFIEGVHFAQTA